MQFGQQGNNQNQQRLAYPQQHFLNHQNGGPQMGHMPGVHHQIPAQQVHQPGPQQQMLSQMVHQSGGPHPQMSQQPGGHQMLVATINDPIPQQLGAHYQMPPQMVQPPQMVLVPNQQPQNPQYHPQAPIIPGPLHAGNLQEVTGALAGFVGQLTHSSMFNGQVQGGQQINPQLFQQASSMLSMVNALKQAIDGLAQQQPMQVLQQSVYGLQQPIYVHQQPMPVQQLVVGPTHYIPLNLPQLNVQPPFEQPVALSGVDPSAYHGQQLIHSEAEAAIQARREADSRRNAHAVIEEQMRAFRSETARKQAAAVQAQHEAKIEVLQRPQGDINPREQQQLYVLRQQQLQQQAQSHQMAHTQRQADHLQKQAQPQQQDHMQMKSQEHARVQAPCQSQTQIFSSPEAQAKAAKAAAHLEAIIPTLEAELYHPHVPITDTMLYRTAYSTAKASEMTHGEALVWAMSISVSYADQMVAQSSQQTVTNWSSNQSSPKCPDHDSVAAEVRKLRAGANLRRTSPTPSSSKGQQGAASQVQLLDPTNERLELKESMEMKELDDPEEPKAPEEPKEPKERKDAVMVTEHDQIVNEIASVLAGFISEPHSSPVVQGRDGNLMHLVEEPKETAIPVVMTTVACPDTIPSAPFLVAVASEQDGGVEALPTTIITSSNNSRMMCEPEINQLFKCTTKDKPASHPSLKTARKSIEEESAKESPKIKRLQERGVVNSREKLVSSKKSRRFSDEDGRKDQPVVLQKTSSGKRQTFIPSSAPKPKTFQNIQFRKEEESLSEEELDFDLNFVPDELSSCVSPTVEVRCDEKREMQNHVAIMSEIFGGVPSGSHQKRSREFSEVKQPDKRTRR